MQGRNWRTEQTVQQRRPLYVSNNTLGKLPAYLSWNMASIIWALLLIFAQLQTLPFTSTAHADAGNLTRLSAPFLCRPEIKPRHSSNWRNPSSSMHPPQDFLHGEMAPTAVSGKVLAATLPLAMSWCSTLTIKVWPVMAWTLRSSILHPFGA